jgi:hypothetical protein
MRYHEAQLKAAHSVNEQMIEFGLSRSAGVTQQIYSNPFFEGTNLSVSKTTS